ncbi:3-ketoacyl-CoA synthase 2-like [Solanum verrucosum]|uniref:3-ketoacyl-CoA synthase 2-like n=1 Tax=Solanum verrucosum TaxID=315347 RepID=UPI0020D1079F|nr:3-ketoacyl-CoA synthase 2-like [Solanum verrucosum]
MAQNVGSNFFTVKNLKLGYHFLISHTPYLFIIPAISALGFYNLLTITTLEDLNNHIILMLKSWPIIIIFFAALYLIRGRPRNVYLVDFACYKPDEADMMSKQQLLDIMSLTFDDEAVHLQKKVLEKSGYSDKTYVPEGIRRLPEKLLTFEESRKETEKVMFGAIDNLLAKTKVKAREIGIIIVNSGLFNPTPSLSSMIVNHYKLGSDVLTYNISGMGCSAGLISIDLANRLLQTQVSAYAMVVSTESIHCGSYLGNDKSKLVSNCLFRMGAAAILLSNCFSDSRRSKYKLMHVVRTHKGADDRAFKSIYQEQDEDGNIGISLSKGLMVVAGETLKSNITTLGPLVLPMSEQLLYFGYLIARKIFKLKNIKPYIPDFKLAFEHFFIHAGGRGVLDEMEKNLDLTEWHMEPSRMTLYRFGNTSSSSLWYELAYSEAKGRIKKGDRAWQIGFGSGFKCNSVVWHALKTINPAMEKNPWTDEIHDFPVNVPLVMPLSV